MNGNGVKKDLGQAVAYFTHLDNKTQLEFADNLFYGVGMKTNKKLAAMMYEHLASNGNMKATKKLALCYLEGDGVKKNIDYAYQLATKIRNTTHDGEDGDIYYIEGQYYASHITYDYYGHPNELQRILECYERAIRYGNTKAARAKAKLKAKYGLREWETI